MSHRLQTPEGKKLYALRKQIPEPVFGIIKVAVAAVAVELGVGVWLWWLRWRLLRTLGGVPHLLSSTT